MNYINVKVLKKYKGKSLAYLHKRATDHFNKWIRLRDHGKGCASCNSPTFTDAGHFYPSGHYPNLRYNENNVHGQCKACNYFKHGNLIEYRKRITNRITKTELIELDYKVALYKRNGYKWDRFFLIEVIETYKAKVKHLENLNNPPF